jgi:Lrp/AsnC family transcriptional regulator
VFREHFPDCLHDRVPQLRCAGKLPEKCRAFFPFLSLPYRPLGTNIPHMNEIDEFDLKIIRELQRDATLTVEMLGEKVNLSRNAAWRRLKRLEDEGYLLRRVAIADAEKLDLGLAVVILVRTGSHEPDWLARFRAAVVSMPEIISVWRMSGDLDYVLRARVRDMKGYDRLYQRLIAKVPLADVSASFVMEEIKETTELPVGL